MASSRGHARARAAWLAPLCLALAILLTVGCYDSATITSLAVAPGGRWVAMLTDHDELGVLDLAQGGKLTLYSTHASGGMGWSPDGKRLAFVEQLPGQGPALWVLNAETGQRAPRPLMRDQAWKAYPCWLSDQTVAFLCDQGSETANLWLAGVRADGSPDRPFQLLDPDADISRLWAAPQGPTVIYQSMEGGQPGLWRWWPGAEHPERLPGEVTEGFGSARTLSFSPDGKRAAYFSDDETGARVIWYDLAARKEAASLTLDRPASDVQVLGDGRVAVSQGTSVLLWRPEAGLFQREERRAGWWDAPVRMLGSIADGGALAVVNGNVIVTTPDPADLEDGRMHVRQDEDAVQLAWQQSQLGHDGPARRILEDLLGKSPSGTPPYYLAALARGELERFDGSWRRADRWLAEAQAAAPAGSAELRDATAERLALAFFDRRDDVAAARALAVLAGPAAADEAQGLTSGGRADFVGTMLAAPDSAATRAWRQVGHDVRGRVYARAATRMEQCFTHDDWTTPNLRGLTVLLDGGLEPLEQAAGRPPSALRPMMNEVAFQNVLLKALRTPSAAAPPAEELRSLLLEQWVVRGDATLARQLVREDLAAHPEAAAQTALGLLRQYLTTEERPDWVDRVVTAALLDPGVVERLLALLPDPSDQLVVRLAETRRALLAGRLDDAQARLGMAWELSQRLPPEAQNIMAILQGRFDRPPRLGGESGGEAAFRQVQDLYRMELYQAKISERKRQWSDALRAYRACLNLLDRVPADWDVAPYELVWNIGLIEEGSRDPALLATFLHLRDQMGDPLLDPTRDAGKTRTALENFETLERSGVAPWLAPHLAFCEGLCWSLLRRPEHALYHLRRVESLHPSDALLQRDLLERSAVRDSLDQGTLAARLDRRILEMRLPLAVRAPTAIAMIQSEMNSGAEIKPVDRMEQLMPTWRLPRVWRDWLLLQVGSDPGDIGSGHAGG